MNEIKVHEFYEAHPLKNLLKKIYFKFYLVDILDDIKFSISEPSIIIISSLFFTIASPFYQIFWKILKVLNLRTYKINQ